ncbi:hypothetical protein [Gymnodinialimonas sp.]
MARLLGAARIFASHYQFVLCEDPGRPLSDEENWTDALVQRGYAGAPDWRMIGTEADLNDHWIELALADAAPDPSNWHRIICCDFETRSGAVNLMGVLADEAEISAQIAPGTYAAHICVRNPGVDQQTTGELDAGAEMLTDTELAAREDLERYRVVLVPGAPKRTGVVFDRESGQASAG